MDTGTPIRLYFMIADHFEPYWNGAGKSEALRRTANWISRYPEIASRFKDSEGRSPRHTFFFPEEEYDAEIIAMLARHCKEGFGDVEIHLHHDRDTSEGLRRKLVSFRDRLHEEHGLLRREEEKGRILYGFVHGNWALDNSRKDGRYCGVNDEIRILGETGCYADFTLPSAPSDTQTKKINSIYYAVEDPALPKSHDDGIDVEARKAQRGDLMIVQGPLGLDWYARKFGIFPRIENSEICQDHPAADHRVHLWKRYAPKVKGMPNHLFIKVHTHGCQESNQRYLLEERGLDHLYGLLEDVCGKNGWRLHFVTAYEMFKIIKCLEAGF
ncbi:hypothetical protein HZA56_18725 [Candidatus Poribacteria bacterium]|nr:hypothetical protein [Candidatus Poribacteria bacterium]